jgi:large repetitive protein
VPSRASLVVAAAIAAVGLGFASAPAFATTTANIYAVPTGGATTGNYPSVCTQADPCSLYWALDQAVTSSNVNNDAAIINLAAGTYTGPNYIESTGGLPASLELLGEGSGPSATVLNGAGSQTLLVDGVNYAVTITNLTLEGGNSGGAHYGGDLEAETSGPGVTLDNDVVTGGTSTEGGQADVTAGTLKIDDTTVENAGTNTDGSEALNGSLEVTDSTYSGNTADAIVSAGTGGVSLYNSTLAGSGGSGLFQDGSGGTLIAQSTITGNADYGLLSGDGEIAFTESILADNHTDCGTSGSGSVVNTGLSVEDDSTCGVVTGSKVSSQIGALALANNGGPTQTERITPSSAAYDFVPAGGCTTDDQRGVPYAQAGKSTCDAGAYQFAPPTLSAVSPAGGEPGSSIQLSGTNLLYATASFGAASVPATPSSPTLTSLTLAMPVLALGPQPITVTNADGSATIAFSSLGPVIASSLAPAEVRHPYSQAISVTGGQGPQTFAIVAGSLPNGLNMSSSGTISGTPTAPATSSFTVKDTDADAVSATAVVSLSVLAPAIGVGHSKLKFKHSKAVVVLSCDTAACSGKVEITRTTHVKVKKHHKTKRETKTIVLASGSYSLAAGATGEVAITLSAAGHHYLRAIAKHASNEPVTVTVLGGASKTTTLKVS